MRIESLKIKQVLFECVYEFRSTFNLVFSRKNSVGKTSMLRLLMYSLGYAIPSTRGLNFHKFELYTEITDDHGKTILIYRNQDFMMVTADGNETGYSLPNVSFWVSK